MDNMQFELPNDNWEPATPPPGQLFMAMRKGDFQYFRPNISADSAELQPDATLEAAADMVAARLGRLDEEAAIVKRRIDEEKGLGMQQVDLEVPVAEGVRRKISQAQTLTVMHEKDGDRRFLLVMMLTAETDSLAEHGPDFEAFLQSVKQV